MIIAGGVEDHVHLLARQARIRSQADWIKELKRASTLWLKSQHPELRDFAWQTGYGIFSVSTSHLEAVEKYVTTQEIHHQKMTFQDEFREMLKRHEIEWDEECLWD